VIGFRFFNVLAVYDVGSGLDYLLIEFFSPFLKVVSVPYKISNSHWFYSVAYWLVSNVMCLLQKLEVATTCFGYWFHYSLCYLLMVICVLLWLVFIMFFTGSYNGFLESCTGFFITSWFSQSFLGYYLQILEFWLHCLVFWCCGAAQHCLLILFFFLIHQFGLCFHLDSSFWFFYSLFLYLGCLFLLLLPRG